MRFSKRSILGVCCAILSLSAAKAQPAPEVLTFDELVTLSETDQPAARLEEKLDTAVFFRGAGGASVTRKKHPRKTHRA